MKYKFKSTLVLYSGGQDSTTCLFTCLHHPEFYGDVHLLSVYYGQKHQRELRAAEQVLAIADKHYPGRIKNAEVLRLPEGVLAGTSPLVNSSQQVEQYADSASLPGGLEKTYVPGRNLLFLTLAANRAYNWGCDAIMTGVSQEDFGGYPDCREDFIVSAEAAIKQAFPEDVSISILAPLIHLSKKLTVELANKLGEPCMQALAYSHTCYNGVFPPCGKCHSCLLRQKGFDEAGVVDPLIARAKAS